MDTAAAAVNLLAVVLALAAVIVAAVTRQGVAVVALLLLVAVTGAYWTAGRAYGMPAVVVTVAADVLVAGGYGWWVRRRWGLPGRRRRVVGSTADSPGRRGGHRGRR